MSTPYLPAVVINEALTKIEGATHLHLVEGANIPTDRAEVLANTVGNIAVSGGDFTQSDVSGGRRLTLAKKDDAAITQTSSDARWFALIDGDDMLYAKQVSGAPLSVTEATTRDFEFGFLEIMFDGVNV